ncbi:MAG: DUF503 domain-containing protein [Bacillota bacterium]|nr:DUF503 domain-containing protein [Bacillota bacterium]
MVIGVCRIELALDDVFSLKEKRHIVKSIIERLKARYNASVAEIDLNDTWKNAVIGVSCVSNDAKHIDSMLNNIVNFVENDGRGILYNYSTEKIYID